MLSLPPVSIDELRLALQASWRPDTAYQSVDEPGNPALGQCYPTCRVVQWFFPYFEIAKGRVDTGSSIETHFWDVDARSQSAAHLDLTWQQFPGGSRVLDFELLDRDTLGDSPRTVLRCNLLLSRVLKQLAG